MVCLYFYRLNCMNGEIYTNSPRKLQIVTMRMCKKTWYKRRIHSTVIITDMLISGDKEMADSSYLLTECARERVEPLEALSARVGRRILAARLSSTPPSSSSSPLLRPSTRQLRLPALVKYRVRSPKFIWAPVYSRVQRLPCFLRKCKGFTGI